MSEQGLSLPLVVINNEAWKIVPNSVEFRKGKKPTTVTAVASGNEISTVHTENAEEAKSYFKVDTKSTKEYVDRIQELADLTGEIVIEFTQKSDGTSIPFSGMSLINDPTVPASADGVISWEFEGDPVL